MGMFDTIKYKGISYQTHDLEEEMANYEIREDGRLYKDIGKCEPAGAPPDAVPGSYAHTFGTWKWVSEGFRDENYHGVIEIGRSVEKSETCPSGYDELLLKFTNGILVEEKPLPIENLSMAEAVTDKPKPTREVKLENLHIKVFKRDENSYRAEAEGIEGFSTGTNESEALGNFVLLLADQRAKA